MILLKNLNWATTTLSRSLTKKEEDQIAAKILKYLMDTLSIVGESFVGNNIADIDDLDPSDYYNNVDPDDTRDL